MQLFDTHNHFDFTEFDADRMQLAQDAYTAGVQKMLITGYVAKYFSRLVTVQNSLNTHFDKTPKTHIAFGLHPAYILEHKPEDIDTLIEFVQKYCESRNCIALGEIGIDTFTNELKQPDVIEKQIELFRQQLLIAENYELPVILHIRKAHALCIKILKETSFSLGGIAHSFSGGFQEAKALTKLGFKLGITGQVCNPNAKKLRKVVKEVGSDHLVIETDCPDMLPMGLQMQKGSQRNEPKNLILVLTCLAELLSEEKDVLAERLWQNSLHALKL